MTSHTELAPEGGLRDHWRADAADTATFEVANPATGAPIDVFRCADAAEVNRHIEAAVSAFRSWSRTTPAERANLLLRLASAIEAHADELAALESTNVGKPLAAAAEEVTGAVDALQFMAGVARTSHVEAVGEYVSGSTSMVRREPLGAVALITPWNFPLMEAAWKIGPALATGNTVVLKPSELTPITTLRLGDLAKGILPDGVLNIVLGAGDTGRALVDHPDVRLVSVTGAVATGKAVAASAARTLKRVHLELGGKAPVLVFSDVEGVTAAARELVQAAFGNSGQDCCAACRVIVEDAAYDDFVSAYCQAAAELTVGDPTDSATQIGPVISAVHRERIRGFVDRAHEAGAQVLVGGKCDDRDGFFYPPTVITDLTQDAEIIQSEVFGPVATIQRARGDDSMLAMANDVPYGLAASVWTSDLRRAMRFSRDLQFGTVWINQHFGTATEMPFGGFGESGYGKELSAHALDEYTQLKHIMIKE
ncbi:aminobutyraldehyde dehydrogenase [Mycobacterium sp. 48b]|uniref:aminobutyraldehyde dehydrogenase n=1 Tax=Mycobacterium sp. 48b TaxID=3400426 RepID=UPI003AABFDA3